ncbi:MAG: hypothetical protein QOF14_1522 [Hyphomicrobiales bacterium]|nr:hypothetical protein [Hyphomicrobiales bacterium]
MTSTARQTIGSLTDVVRSVVFIDPSVSESRSLLEGVRANHLAVVLDRNTDGLDQIAEILAARGLRDLPAIHIVSHGTPGQIHIGATLLNARALAGHAGLLADIGAALAPGGGILLYGCDVASGATGRQFIEELSIYTGADVAAASHPVGAAEQGASWELDVSTGPIAAGLAFTPETMAAYRGVFAAPTLTAMAAPVDTVNEDTQVEITFAEIAAQGNEADDGTVVAFVVKAVSTGTLLIGTSPGTALAFAAGTNDTIDATHQAYWTGAQDANGTLNAFTVVARDDEALESATPVQVQVSVTAVNDAPTLTAMAAPVDTVNEDTQVEITFAEIAAQGNEADVDGSVTAFVVKAVTSGTLLIGTSPGTATAFAVGTNDTIDGSNNAYWTGASNANGTLNAFTVVAKDDGTPGLESATPVQVQVSVTAVNDKPTLTANSANMTFTEGGAAGASVQGAAVAVFSGASTSTIEAGQGIIKLVFTVNGLQDSANERLVIDGTAITLGGNSSGTTAGGINVGYAVTVAGGFATVTLTKASPGVTPANLDTLINGITYQDTNVNAPTAGDRTFKLTQVQDNGGTANGGLDTTTLSISSAVHVVAVNDGPVNTVPGSTVNATEDTPVSITGVSIADVDAVPQNVQVTLHVDNGILDVNTAVAGGVTAAQVTGDTTGTVVVTGTTAQINATLADANGLKYQGNLNFHSTDTLTVTTSDLGHSGTGGALTDSDTRPISVAAASSNTLTAFQTSTLKIDTDGDGKIDPGETVTVSVTIANNSTTTAATGVSFNEASSVPGDPAGALNGLTQVGGIHVTPIAFDDSYTGVAGNTPISLSLLSNDVDPNGLQSGLKIASVVTDANTHGTLTFTAGVSTSVIYTPDTGFGHTGAADGTNTATFKYFTVDSEGLVSNEASTVTVIVNGGNIWYVDGAASSSGQDGSFDHPFVSLAQVNGVTGDGTTNDDVDGTGDTIFVYDNAGGTLTYTGGIVLEAGQKLIGDGVAFTVNSAVTGGSSLSVGHSADNTAGNPTITTSVAAANDITLASGNTVQGITLGNTGAGGNALSGSGFGTLTIDHVAINTNGEALNLTTGAFGAGATFSSITSTGGANNISLTGITGSVTLGDSSSALSGATGAAFNVSGGTVSTTYSGNIIQASNAALVNVTGNHTTGTLTFQIGTLAASNGTGLQFNDADGNYNFNGTTTLNGGNAGIDITNGSSGAFTFGSNTSITSPTGAALDVQNSTANVTYNGTITQNNAAAAVNVANETGGTVDINGLVTASTSTQTAINLATNTGAAIQFDGGLNIDTTSGTGFNATGGGTVRVSATAGDESINSTSGQALNLSGVAIDAANGLNFDSTTSGGGTNGVKIASTSGGAIALGGGSLSSATGAGFLVGDGVGGANTGGTAAITYSGSITTTGTARAVDIEDRAVGAANVTLSGTVSHASGNGSTFFLDQNAAGTITFSGANSVANSGTASAINVSNSANTVTFSGSGLNVDTTSGNAVNLASNTGATIGFSGGGLLIDTTTGTGFNATGGGTVTVTGTGNKINSDGAITHSGTALNVTSTTIGASGLTFQSIAAGNAGGGPTNGIVLNTTGTSGGLTVTGDGTAANNGSGGTIQKATGDGISLTSTMDVHLAQMNIQNNLGDGIGGTTVNGLVLNRFNISGNGDSAATDESGINIAELTGTASGGLHPTAITNSSITNNEEFEVRISNTTGTLTNFQFNNNTVSANGVAINGNASSPHSDLVSFQALGTATMGITTSGGTYTGNIDTSGGKIITATGLFIDSSGTSSTVTANVSGGTFLNNNNAVTVSTAQGGNLDFDITGTTSTFNRSHGLNLFVAASSTGTITGAFTNNIVGTAGVQNSGSEVGFGIRVQNEGSTVTGNPTTVLITGNNIHGMGSTAVGGFAAINVNDGIAAQTFTRTLNATITNNIIDDVYGNRAIIVQQNNSTAPGTVNASISGNDLGNNIAGNVGDGTVIRLRQLAGGTFNLTQTQATAANTATELDNANTFGAHTTTPAEISISGTITYGQPLPSQPPLLAAPGGVEAAPATQWQVAGVGDFNGDGATDLLSLRSDGLLKIDTFNSAGEAINWYIPGQLEAGWSIVGIGDINNDGTSDIVLRHDSGAFEAELIQNSAVAATVDLELVNGTLQLVAPPAPDAPPSDSPPSDPPPANPPPAELPAQAAPGTVETHLTQAELDGIVQTAIARWEATGLTAEQDAYLHSVSFSVSDLAGLYLGSALPGHITIDADAAGYGWYVDANPADDAEFANVLGATRLQTDPSGVPAGHIDLLSTVMHELGHQLGLEDSYALSDRDDLMFGYLVTGERRLPGEHEAAGATPGSIDHEEFAVGPVSIGTLPANRTVTITFDATVNAQTNQQIVNPSNQGTVTSSFPSINTNTNVTTLDTLAIGDLVFNDLNFNGVYDAGIDAGINGVTLRLYADTNASGGLDAGDLQIGSTVTTAGGGLYSFTGLAPGDYIVAVESTNFTAGHTLYDGANSQPFSSVPGNPDPDAPGGAGVDNDDNGGAIGVAGVTVASLPITLAYNTETTAGTGNDTNNTLDLGFQGIQPNNAPLVTAGNAVTFTETGAGGGPAIFVDNAITVTDDGTIIDSATVTISSGFFAGDVLSFDSALASSFGISGGFAGNALSLSGTTSDANYQAVLRTVKYQSTSDNPDNFGTDTTRTITWTVNDGTQDNSVLATTNITITAENDAPDVASAGSLAGTPGNPINVTGISFSDADSNLAEVATFSAPSGTFAAVNGGGVTVGGSGTSTLTLTGTTANLNTFINGNHLTYTTPSSQTFSVTLNDQGNTGSGGPLTDSVNVSVVVNELPVLDLDVNAVGNGYVSTFTEDAFGGTPTPAPIAASSNDAVPSDTSITDNDDTNMESATITLTNPLSGDTLDIDGGALALVGIGSPITVLSKTPNQIVLTGSASKDDYASALQLVTFSNTSDNPATTDRIVNTVVNDGTSNSNTAVTTIHVIGVNDAPVVDLNGAGSGTSAALAYTENDAATFIAPSGTVTDVDSANFNGGSLTVGFTANGASEDQLIVKVDGTVTIAAGTVSVGGNAVGTVSGGVNGAPLVISFNSANATQAAISTLLEHIAYSNNSDHPSTAQREVTYTLDDGDGTANFGENIGTATATIDITSVNDTPVNSVPLVAQSVNEDSALVFNTANSNLISVTDVDANPDNIRVTLLAAHGALTLSTTAGLSFSAGDGTSDATMTFDGTVAAVNTALNGLAYLGQSNFNGGDTLTIITNDLGHNGADPGLTGDGSSEQDTDIVTINVAAVNDTPVNSVPAAAQAVNEDTDLVFNAANGNAISIADLDANPDDVRITLTATNGVLTLSTIAGLSFGTGDGTQDATMTFDGTVAEVNAALDGLIYHGNLNYFGGATLSITTNDLGHNGLDPGLTGTGSTEQDSDTVTINVASVNDSPVFAGLDNTPTFVENGSSVVLDNNATVSDVELDAAGSYEGAQLTLVRHTGANSDDVFGATGTLDLVDSNGLGENVSLDGGATFIGTFSQPGDGTFAITFNANATAAEVNSVLHQITYSNVGDNPPASLQIDYTFSDGNGIVGGQAQGSGPTPGIGTGSITVNITQIDDAPTLSNVAPAAAYTLGSSGVVLSSGLQVFDPDATPPSPLTGIANATIKFDSAFLATDQLFVNLTTSGGFFRVDDGNGGLVTTNISVLSNAGGTMVLSGNDSVTHYQSVLDAVSYRSTAADPSNGGLNPTRTISWQVNDGLLNSQTPNPDPNNLVNETILHFNAPPTVDLDASGAGTGFTTTFTERDAPIAIADTDLSVTDPDNSNLSSMTIVLTNAKASDVMSIAGALPGGVDSSIDTSVAGQITVHLVNSASLADYQTALGRVRFSNTSVIPNTTDRDITVVANDGDADSNVAHATIHVVDKPNAPFDFNGDGKGDILWQNSDGTPAVWLLNGTGVLSTGPALLNPHTPWHEVGSADFNGDGKSDILWQNVDGTPAVWLMDGTSVMQTGPALSNPGPTWHANEAADFNGDGKADILWQHDSGLTGVWLMNGTSVLSAGGALPNADASWHAQAAGDFNGDGKADILWQNDSGAARVWLMDGTTVLAAGNALANPGSTWHVKEAIDANADGKADILWQNNDGTPGVWLMDGTSVLQTGGALSNPGAAWHII